MDIYEKANALHLEGNYAEASRLYDELLAQNPDNAGLLAMFGSMLIRSEATVGQGISMLYRACEKDMATPKKKRHGPLGDMLGNLAVGYRHAGLVEKSRETFTRAAQVDPSGNTLANYAGLFINVGTPEEAVKHARRAIALDAHCAMAHWNLAMGLLELGEWESAWDEHEWGFHAKMRIDRGASLLINGQPSGIPRWDGSPEKTVWVYGEQGLGDEIMFASMLPDMMKTNTVILECHQRLETLFRKSFPDLTVYGTREATSTPWLKDHQIDAQISIGSLGQFYRRSVESFPGTAYLKADPSSQSKMRVGISWTGGFKAGRVRTRAVPLPMWGSILDTPEVEFVSLQYGADASADIEVVERAGGYTITQSPAVHAHDYMETARLVQSCDLVISVCTSLVHLAGALGVPTWCMVPKYPAWRYGVRGPMRFYRSVRLYRQPPAAEDWQAVVSRVALDLNDLINAREEKAA